VRPAAAAVAIVPAEVVPLALSAWLLPRTKGIVKPDTSNVAPPATVITGEFDMEPNHSGQHAIADGRVAVVSVVGSERQRAAIDLGQTAARRTDDGRPDGLRKTGHDVDRTTVGRQRDAAIRAPIVGWTQFARCRRQRSIGWG